LITNQPATFEYKKEKQIVPPLFQYSLASPRYNYIEQKEKEPETKRFLS